MSFLEQIGLLTLIFFGIYLLNGFLNAQKEYQRKLDEDLRANAEAAAKYRELEVEKRERKKEEEYLIRVGKIKSPLFNPDLYKGFPGIPPWGSSVEQEKYQRNTNKINPFIKVDDIIKNYGIPVETLELLYRDYPWCI
jgi:hypothetical protein